MTEIITGILGNYILQCAFVSWLTAQILKTLINLYLTDELKLERMVGAGGMPSSHTAFVVSTAIAVAKQCGTASTEFAIAAVVASVVIYDAMGVRRAAGEQAKIINKMVDQWFDKAHWNGNELIQAKKLKEMLGHTPLEVLGGIVVAVVISLIV